MLQYIAALVIAGHGIGHISAFLASFTSIDVGFKDNPWAFSDGVTLDAGIGHVFGVLALVVMAIFVTSSVGILLREIWWRQLAMYGSVLSSFVVIPFWNSVPAGMLAGVALNVAIILVLTLPWGKKVTAFFKVP